MPTLHDCVRGEKPPKHGGSVEKTVYRHVFSETSFGSPPRVIETP